jgi:photosystem II stability/assembly factor-like uncharacterized protein
MGTSDGGTIWTKQLTYSPPAGGNSSNATLTSVACADSSHVVAVGSGEGETEIFRTADGGATWRKIAPPAGRWIDLEHVAFVDASHGWAVGDGTVIATTDGGRTWTRQSVGPSDGLSDLSFVSRTRGWVVGDGAAILTTTTGGGAP